MLNERRIPVAKLSVVIIAAVAMKQFYSTAGANELGWILTPTALLVELATGVTFTFESGAGLFNPDHSFLIAPACAGVNFLITAFLLLTCSRLLRYRSLRTSWLYVCLAGATAYATTVIANAFRIAIALMIRDSSHESEWLTAEQIHRLEGIVVYFGFLVTLFIVSERLTAAGKVHSTPSPNLSRRFLPPLLTYYATAFGVPLVNGFLHGSFGTSEFWEYSLFVLISPAVLLVPVFVYWLGRKGQAAGSDLARNIEDKEVSPTRGCLAVDASVNDVSS